MQRETDFPFYNGIPTRLNGRQWSILMAAVVFSFIVLVMPVPMFSSPMTQIVPAILFAAIPLWTLAKLVPQHWKVLFRKPTGRDLLWAVLFALLNLLVTVAVAQVVSQFYEVSPNAAVNTLTTLENSEKVLFFLKTLPQLLGEEIFSILPFLALLTLFCNWLKLSRTTAIILAWLLTGVMFGMAHLPTYNWNLVQCIVIIGSARLVLTLAFIKTKSLWVSTLAHIINDWTLFIIAMILGSMTLSG